MANTFDVASWPILALAAPIAAVIAAVIAANIAYRFWLAGSIGAPVVVVSLLVAMMAVAAIVWKFPAGRIVVDDTYLTLQRGTRIPGLDFSRQLQLETTYVVFKRWSPDRTGTLRGVQLWAEDDNTTLRVGIANLDVLGELASRHQSLFDGSATGMPHAVLTEADFAGLSLALGLPAADSDTGELQ